MSENLEDWREKLRAATAGQSSVEEVDNSTLDCSLSISCYRSLRENDETYRTAEEITEAKLERMREFHVNFDNVLKEFCMEKEWLAASVFRGIWNGTGKLQTEAYYMESVPESISSEIDERLGRDKTNDDEIDDHFKGSQKPEIPFPDSFTYQEEYKISFPFDYYVENAVAAYLQHLRDYLAMVKESFKKHGYKERRGDRYDYSSVRWLIWWNIKKSSKIEILEKIEKETRGEAARGREYDQNTIEKAFRKFGKYNLPVRK